jgi:hypothetical protein
MPYTSRYFCLRLFGSLCFQITTTQDLSRPLRSQAPFFRDFTRQRIFKHHGSTCYTDIRALDRSILRLCAYFYRQDSCFVPSHIAVPVDLSSFISCLAASLRVPNPGASQFTYILPSKHPALRFYAFPISNCLLLVYFVF